MLAFRSRIETALLHSLRLMNMKFWIFFHIFELAAAPSRGGFWVFPPQPQGVSLKIFSLRKSFAMSSLVAVNRNHFFLATCLRSFSMASRI